MIKTKLSFHKFEMEEFLTKMGLNDDDVLLIEDVSLETSRALNGNEFRSVLVELRRSTPTAKEMSE